jgi:hypothetical protein
MSGVQSNAERGTLVDAILGYLCVVLAQIGEVVVNSSPDEFSPGEGAVLRFGVVEFRQGSSTASRVGLKKNGVL